MSISPTTTTVDLAASSQTISYFCFLPPSLLCLVSAGCKNADTSFTKCVSLCMPKFIKVCMFFFIQTSVCVCVCVCVHLNDLCCCICKKIHGIRQGDVPETMSVSRHYNHYSLPGHEGSGVNEILTSCEYI